MKDLKEHNRFNSIRKFIDTVSEDVDNSKLQIKIITPHMRKHGGPTTLANLANLLSDKGYDVNMAMCYTDYNPEVLEFCKVPMKTSYEFKQLNESKNGVIIINSDNPFAEEIMKKNPYYKFIMYKLSHNLRFRQIEADNLNLNWDHIITSTEWLRQACINKLEGWEHKEWFEDKVTCVGWNHYAHETFNCHPQNRVYGDSTSGIRVGTLIHHHHLKGSQIAIDAFNGLKKKYNGMIHLVGVGECKAKLPFGFQYFLSPTRNEMAQIMKQLDIWFGASHTEGLGRIALEVMSAGCAVITTNTGAEFLRDRENCLLYEPGNAQKGAELVDELIQDKDLFKQLIIEGYKTACDAASSDKYIESVEKVIKKVLNDEN